MNSNIFKMMLSAAALVLFVGSAQATVVNFGSIGTGTSATVNVADVTVSGSAAVSYNDVFSTSSNGGLGVVGNIFPGGDNTLDLGETLTFDFDFLVTDVFLTSNDIAPAGNVTYGFTAFSGASNLGFFGLPSHSSNTETFNLSALVGQSFDSFTVSLSASAPLGLVIEQLDYTAASVPEASSLYLLAFGLLGLFGVARRKA